MDIQFIIDIIFGMVTSIIGWFGRELWTAVKELKMDIAKLREDLPKTYVFKDDYRQDVKELKDMIGKLFDKLDNKQSK